MVESVLVGQSVEFAVVKNAHDCVLHDSPTILVGCCGQCIGALTAEDDLGVWHCLQLLDEFPDLGEWFVIFGVGPFIFFLSHFAAGN